MKPQSFFQKKCETDGEERVQDQLQIPGHEILREDGKYFLLACSLSKGPA